MFSRAMSAMYKPEVPQYRALAELVARLNREALNADREIEGKRRSELGQLGMERHGAIRWRGAATVPAEVYRKIQWEVNSDRRSARVKSRITTQEVRNTSRRTPFRSADRSSR